MGRACIVLTMLFCAAPPVSGRSEEGPTEPGPLIDLTSTEPQFVGNLDRWLAPRNTDLYLCDIGETPGPALLGTIRAGALILSRDCAHAQPSGRILRAGDNEVLLDAKDMRLGTSAGLDLTLLSAISEALELEVRYFGIDGWSASRTVGDPAGVRFEGFGLTSPGQTERLDYASRLYNFEINARPRVAEGIPLILGFRHLQLHEQFSVSRLDPQPTVLDLSVHTNNYLYGFQIGAEPYLLGAGGPLRLDGLLKAGVYGNHASQGVGSSLLAASAGAGQDRVSFVGELGLMLDYRFGQFLAVRAGYEVLWLYGVALAPDQSRATRLMVPAAELNSAATSFYHGAAASLEFVF